MNSPQTKFRNLLPKALYYILCLAIFISSCSKDDGGGEVDIKSSDKQITSFLFSATSNPTLDQDINGVINQDNNTISLVVPFGISLSTFQPSITISIEATISPSTATGIDFSAPVVFTVTAEDGSTVDYTVSVSNAENSEKSIIEFKFTVEENPSLTEEILGSINDNDRTIEAEVPFSIDISTLTPSLVLSDAATSTPSTNTVVDFTSTVNFEVRAEDGSTADYAITITKRESDFETLRAIFNANPSNSLNWDFNNLDISTYEGVTAENDRVTALSLSAKGLTVLPAEIGDLPMLSLLYLQNNAIESLPSEIENLSSSLTQFLLSNNPVKSLPPEIGNLANLEFLDLFNADLTSLPSEIGNLNNLFSLNLSQNFDLTGLPIEIGNLSNLNRLSLIGANYTIPTEIGNLNNLTFLNLSSADLNSFPSQVLGLTNLDELRLSGNSIASVPTGINSLTNLTKLFLDSNSLTSLPVEIAELTNLTTLNITANSSLTSIPQIICDMESNGTEIIKDAATTCN